MLEENIARTDPASMLGYVGREIAGCNIATAAEPCCVRRPRKSLAVRHGNLRAFASANKRTSDNTVVAEMGIVMRLDVLRIPQLDRELSREDR
jgi:hypothetical protein